MKLLDRKAMPLAIFLALAAAGGAASCNTIRGAGQDVEAAGSAVATEAAETERELNDGNPRTP